MKKKKTSNVVFCLFFLALLVSNTGCEPLEAITDTYAEIVDGAFPEEDNKEDTVGSVLMTTQESVGDTNDATLTIIVLDQNGDRIKRPVFVECTFTNRFTNELITRTTGITIDGQTTCDIVNGSEFSVSFLGVATAEGVTSEITTLGISGTSTSA